MRETVRDDRSMTSGSMLPPLRITTVVPVFFTWPERIAAAPRLPLARPPAARSSGTSSACAVSSSDGDDLVDDLAHDVEVQFARPRTAIPSAMVGSSVMSVGTPSGETG